MGEVAVVTIGTLAILVESFTHDLLAVPPSRRRPLPVPACILLLLLLLAFDTLAITIALAVFLAGTRCRGRWKGSPLRTFGCFPDLSLSVLLSELSLLVACRCISEKLDVLLTVAFRESVPGVPVTLKALDFLDLI